MINISLPGDSKDGNNEVSKSQVKALMKVPLSGDSQDEDSDKNIDDDDDDDDSDEELPLLI